MFTASRRAPASGPASGAPMSAPEAASLSPAEITRRSRSNFALSFAFLAKERRRALRAIYAYCRAVDDAADDPEDPATAREHLGFWRDELARVAAGDPRTETGRELRWAASEFDVEIGHLREILDGVAMDLDPVEFVDLAALDAYCHKVASAVGLACLPVFGAEGPKSEEYATTLGLALQLTNVLRDLRTDAVRGRVYLPRDALERHGVDPAWLRGEAEPERYAKDGPVHGLVSELAAIAAQRFARTDELLDPRARSQLVPAEIMKAVYRRLLARIERRRGRIDRQKRVRLGRARKLSIALSTWWRCRR